MRRLLLTDRSFLRGVGAWVVSVVMVVAVALLVTAGPAAAHRDLVDASPGPGDALSPGASLIRLDAGVVLPDTAAYIALLDESGTPLPVGTATVLDQHTLCARVETMTPGVYTVEYSATAVDGHRLGGRYLFEVAANGVASEPGACAEADLAATGEAQSLAEMSAGAGLPAWTFLMLGGAVLLSAAGVVVRARRDRRGVAD